MFHGVFSFGNSTSVVGQAICLRATMKIKQGHDNQIERSTSEICKLVKIANVYCCETHLY